MICFSLQCINRQSSSPCSLTNLHVFTAACSVPVSLCVIHHLSYVFSISPASLCLPLGSRCLVLSAHLSLVFTRLTSAVLSPPLLTKTLGPQCFPSLFLSPEVYATAFLFYLISRPFLDSFCFLAILQRSAVFSNRQHPPLVDSESRFLISRPVYISSR